VIVLIEFFLGFTKGQRAPKRLWDIVPDDVVVDGPLSSEAEDSDLEMSPSKVGKPRGKLRKRKAKKDDGWIWKWFERVTGHSGDNGKLAEYKKESKCVIDSFACILTNY
jgi:hypothetical protein